MATSSIALTSSGTETVTTLSVRVHGMRGQFARFLLIKRVQPTANRLGHELLGEELSIAVVETHKAATDFSRPSNGTLF